MNETQKMVKVGGVCGIIGVLLYFGVALSEGLGLWPESSARTTEVTPSPPRREVAITIDDLPGTIDSIKNLRALQAIADQLLSALVKHRVPAIGFVNESRIYVPGEVDARINLLRRWLDAGMTLGNHSFSHPDLNDTPLQQYEDDVIHGEVITRQLMREKGLNKLYFRFPYNHTGPTREAKNRLEEFLKARHYVIAPFTIEHADYVFNKVYLKAIQDKNDELTKRIRTAYLDFLDTMFDYFERRSQEYLGYEVKQIFLIHANELNAACLDEMIQKLKKRGYAFITLDQALQDTAYQIKDDYVGQLGISWLHRWTISLGIKMNNRDEPDPPQFILDLYQAM